MKNKNLEPVEDAFAVKGGSPANNVPETMSTIVESVSVRRGGFPTCKTGLELFS